MKCIFIAFDVFFGSFYYKCTRMPRRQWDSSQICSASFWCASSIDKIIRDCLGVFNVIWECSEMFTKLSGTVQWIIQLVSLKLLKSNMMILCEWHIKWTRRLHISRHAMPWHSTTRCTRSLQNTNFRWYQPNYGICNKRQFMIGCWDEQLYVNPVYFRFIHCFCFCFLAWDISTPGRLARVFSCKPWRPVWQMHKWHAQFQFELETS